MPHERFRRVIVGLPRWQCIGPAIFAERLVRGLLALGHDARILLTESGSMRVQEQWQEPSVPEDLPCDTLPIGPDVAWGDRWQALERYLEERAPCYYLMLHDWRNNIIAPRLSRRIRLIGLVQADNEHDIGQAVRLGEYWDAIVAVCDPIHFKLLDKISYLAPRMTTIRNAVPELECPPAKPAGTLRIAYSGELRAHQKRLDDMVAVACRLAGRGVDFHLEFFGDGPYRAHLEKETHGLVTKGLVSFAGRLDGPELLSRLEGQHVFLLTSEFEGLSIALLEAMSRGCVPVVSRLASQSLVIREGVNGLAANVGDIDGFGAHLERLASDRALLAKFSAAAFSTIAAGGYRVRDMLENYLSLFDRIDRLSGRGGFVRKRGPLAVPPKFVGGVGILLGSHESELVYVNETAPWPDPPASPKKITVSRLESCPPLQDHKVIVASTPGAISGVDVFSRHLIRGLRKRGIEAMLHGRKPAEDEALPADTPFDSRDPLIDEDFLGWPARWRMAADHLERLAPCIYLPNYDYDYSGVCPVLSERIRVVGIAHSDDPEHYGQLARIGHSCDAIIGVSKAITRHLGGLLPQMAPRMHTVPYGISLGQTPPATPRAPRRPGDPLRIVFAGRLVRHQKRVSDILKIARELDRRAVDFELAVVGDGKMRGELEKASRDLILCRKVWFALAQPNEGVLSLLAGSHAFLLPSSFEGLSVGMLEAMLHGVVPVVSDIRSGVPDVIRSGKNGLIAPVGDVVRFADHLEWLWKNPGECHQLGVDAAQTVRQGFDVETMVDRYIQIFEAILKNPLPRPCGPMAPPLNLKKELTISSWASRVASDPMASLQRVYDRIRHTVK